MVDTTMMINGAVLLGVAAVLPLALGHCRRWWFAAAAGVVSLAAPTGSAFAVVTAAVWALVAGVGLAEQLATSAGDVFRRRPAGEHGGPRWSRLEPSRLVLLGASAYALVAATAFLASRSGRTLFGIGEPIVELTAVHFTYAGVGALTLAGAALCSATGPTVHFARVAVALTLCAPPVVGLGFVTGQALPQVGGAVLMTLGVLTTAALQLWEAARPDPDRTTDRRSDRVLLALSGFAPWAPMALAVAWAAALYWRVPALDIPAMVRSHGSLNTVFVVLGLLARRPRRSSTVGAGATDPSDPVTHEVPA